MTKKIKSKSAKPSKGKTIKKSNTNSILKSTIKSPIKHVRYGFICLFIAWLFALLPVPIVSYIGFYIFNVTALILAVVSFFKDQVKSGIILFISATFGSLIMYLLGLFIMGTISFGSWAWLLRLFKK
ncbi:MAG: hypothetical protein L6Q54_10530 [Leptospiraceae bacterium]|nr:hypothetical protein [Leptospiraceae bacterium]MCK6381663.1 hypothetical protein [Leptospiraceae bacterium]